MKLGLILWPVVAIAAFALLSSGAFAQTAPFPGKRVNPDYPDSLATKRIEGWSTITFHRAATG
ncbi:MAG TPA: hypothetical protein VFT98_21550, partial [Myxococcota bacterium]|nr:hypothetical protein [Myxococcota bacterium]